MPNCIHMLLKNSIKMPIFGPSRGDQMKISIVKYCQIIWLCWSLLKKNMAPFISFFSSGAKLFFSFWKKPCRINNSEWTIEREWEKNCQLENFMSSSRGLFTSLTAALRCDGHMCLWKILFFFFVWRSYAKREPISHSTFIMVND